MAINEASQGILSSVINPRINAVGHDVIESTEVGLDSSREVRGMKFDIFNCTFRRKTPCVFDMRRHKIDAAKPSGRMCCGEYCRGQTLPATEIAPGEFPIP